MLWELAKDGFAYYLRNLARVAGLYGTLEGVIVLAIWLELSVSIILYCGEIVALLIGAPRTRRVAERRHAAAAQRQRTDSKRFSLIRKKDEGADPGGPVRAIAFRSWRRTVLILESAAATALIVGSALILRACWRVDQRRSAPLRRRTAWRKTHPIVHRRAA